MFYKIDAPADHELLSFCDHDANEQFPASKYAMSRAIEYCAQIVSAVACDLIDDDFVINYQTRVTNEYDETTSVSKHVVTLYELDDNVELITFTIVPA